MELCRGLVEANSTEAADATLAKWLAALKAALV